jgi:hypothetical protein
MARDFLRLAQGSAGHTSSTPATILTGQGGSFSGFFFNLKEKISYFTSFSRKYAFWLRVTHPGQDLV